MYAEAMFYITVQRNNKLTQVLYSRSLLSRRLDKYTSNFKINVVISAINQVGVPSYSCTSGLLKVRGGHVTCSDQWNLHHTSFLSRNLRAWVIDHAWKSGGLREDPEPAGRHYLLTLPSSALPGRYCSHGRLFHLSGPLSSSLKLQMVRPSETFK